LRTDFTDDAAWVAVCDAIREPNEDEFRAFVDCVSDSRYAGLTAEQLVTLSPQDGERSFAFLVDQRTLADPEHPVLVVDLYAEPGRTFRVIPREAWGG
jgi:hypothetical protein